MLNRMRLAIARLFQNTKRDPRLDYYPDGANTVIRVRCCVLTPIEYQQAGAGRTFPVVYLLHGVRENEKDWGANRHIVDLIDSLVAAKTIPPMVIVMPFGFLSEEQSKAHQMPDRDLYNSALTATIEQVEAVYDRISRNPHQRAIAGISMGGKQSIEFGFANPERFSIVGGLSAALIPAAMPAIFDSLKQPQRVRLYFSRCGRQDRYRLAGPNEAFAKRLREAGVPCDALIDEGGHNWTFWSTQLPILFKSVGRAFEH